MSSFPTKLRSVFSGVDGSTTTTGNGQSFGGPAISSNGQFIAFSNTSTNLVSGQVNGAPPNSDTNVFVFDRLAGTTQVVSHTAGLTTTTGNGTSEFPVISADGQFIAYRSDSTNLVAGQVDSNSGEDVFVFDRLAGTTQLVSGVAGSTTTTGNGESTSPAISGDGQFIAFHSQSTTLVSGEVEGNSAPTCSCLIGWRGRCGWSAAWPARPLPPAIRYPLARRSARTASSSSSKATAPTWSPARSMAATAATACSCLIGWRGRRGWLTAWPARPPPPAMAILTTR